MTRLGQRGSDGFRFVLGASCIAAALCGSAAAQAQAIAVGNAIKLSEESKGWAEVTSAVVPPGRNPACPDGQLLISAAYSTMSIKLDGSNAKIWPLPKASNDPKIHGEISRPWVIHDQHMVSLRDGSVLQSIEAITWNDNFSPRPAWWSWTKDFPLKGQSVPGGRATIYLYRTWDCGATWALIGEVDAGRLAVKEILGIPGKEQPIATAGPFLRVHAALTPIPGLCGTPRRYSKADTRTNFSEGGGWDGHYLYSDPSTGNLVLTTPCAYGSKEIDKQHGQFLWLASRDGGASWYVTRHTDQFGTFRMPVTSDGEGGVVTLYSVVGSFRLQRFGADLAPQQWLDYRSGPIVAPVTPDKRTPEQRSAAQVESHVWAAPILAPARGPGGAVKLGVWNWINNGTVLAYDIYRVSANGSNVRKIDTIRATEPNGDVVEAMFVDGPIDRSADLLYWIERIPRQGEPNQFRIRYQLYVGEAPVLPQPGTLTLANGQPYTWEWKKIFIGEYMGGASYVGADGTIHFAAPWVQNGALYLNTVALSPQAEKAALAGRKLAVEFQSTNPPWRLSR
jgi:hypothetical protein